MEYKIIFDPIKEYSPEELFCFSKLAQDAAILNAIWEKFVKSKIDYAFIDNFPVENSEFWTSDVIAEILRNPYCSDALFKEIILSQNNSVIPAFFSDLVKVMDHKRLEWVIKNLIDIDVYDSILNLENKDLALVIEKMVKEHQQELKKKSEKREFDELIGMLDEVLGK